MAETIFGNGNDQWVCPNDRHLALRAKLHSGWSVHTFQTDRQRKMQALDPKEMEVILAVIRRAEKLDIIEQQRIGRLVQRLENMQKNILGNGSTQCLLCGEGLGFLGSTAVFCQDCKKKVCTKCGIETPGPHKRTVWFCKICSEQREVWKRSGAWFYKGLPKCILPLKGSSSSSNRAKEIHLRPPPARLGPPSLELRGSGMDHTYTWARSKVVSSDSDSDSEISSSSFDNRSLSMTSKSFQIRKQPADSVSSGEAAQSPSGSLGRPLGSTKSESQSSLGSELCSAPEGYQSDHEDSDVVRRAPGKRRILKCRWR
ncbi:rab effector Noc2 [Vipera latastei]